MEVFAAKSWSIVWNSNIDIARFTEYAKKVLKCSSQNGLYLALLYTNKLPKQASRNQAAGSEYRMFLASLMVSDCYLNDNSISMAGWELCSGFSKLELVAMRSEFVQNLNYDLKVDREELTQFVQHIHSLVGKAFPTKPAPIPQNPTMNYPANSNFQLHRTPVNIEQLMSPVSIWSSIPTTSSSPMTTGNVFDFTMMNMDVSLRRGANAHNMWATTPTSLDSSSLNCISSIDSLLPALESILPPQVPIHKPKSDSIVKSRSTKSSRNGKALRIITALSSQANCK